ncbi:YabP/YqfC family sporulation protein [Traorella massiliensis]|uniref:YabP/YqfC family sporulation protein n=1 Tax=Traorella massiliensis TaxID=1903263 RepID=UPI0008F8DD5C|nr:YabP/YqfC family sporulation protein [Traorella massiliensis]
MITLSDERIRIIHYKKITKVSTQEIHIETAHSTVVICGENLFISYLNADEIILKGSIRKVDFLAYERV